MRQAELHLCPCGIGCGIEIDQIGFQPFYYLKSEGVGGGVVQDVPHFELSRMCTR